MRIMKARRLESSWEHHKHRGHTSSVAGNSKNTFDAFSAQMCFPKATSSIMNLSLHNLGLSKGLRV